MTQNIALSECDEGGQTYIVRHLVGMLGENLHSAALSASSTYCQIPLFWKLKMKRKEA